MVAPRLTHRQIVMGVNHINKVLENLDIPPANAVAQGTSLFVCDASEEEWNAFAESDGTVYKANFMEWRDGKIYIVEFPGEGHDKYVDALNFQFHQNAVLDAHFQYLGTSFFSTGPRHMPDLRYRPFRGIIEQLGAVLPAGADVWTDFTTLLIEVDVFSRLDQAGCEGPECVGSPICDRVFARTMPLQLQSTSAGNSHDWPGVRLLCYRSTAQLRRCTSVRVVCSGCLHLQCCPPTSPTRSCSTCSLHSFGPGVNLELQSIPRCSMLLIDHEVATTAD